MPDPLRELPWRRVLLEGAVIVVSILLAFSIDAWWDGQRDRARELSYLRMLETDLRATLQNNQRFAESARVGDVASARLVRAYYQPELPPTDSVIRWFTLAPIPWVVSPRLGTAAALVASGDLDLIRNDSIRAAISEYLTTMSTFDGFEQDRSNAVAAASEELLKHVDLEQLRLGLLTREARDSLAASDELLPLPAGPLRSLPPVDVSALLRDADIHRLLLQINGARRSMRQWRSLMRRLSEGLLQQIETELSG